MARAVELMALVVNSSNLLPLWCFSSCRFLSKAYCRMAFVPRALTDIIVKPVFKSNLIESTGSGNYRPIAIASSAAKLIEKILYSRLDQYITTSANQFGFKK